MTSVRRQPLMRTIKLKNLAQKDNNRKVEPINASKRKTTRITSKFHRDHERILKLIKCVKARPILYNHSRKKTRRRHEYQKNWTEIAAQIGGDLTAEECRTKWKHLRDTYHQYRLRCGEKQNLLTNWRYSSELEFIAKIYRPKMRRTAGIKTMVPETEETPQELDISQIDIKPCSSIDLSACDEITLNEDVSFIDEDHTHGNQHNIPHTDEFVRIYVHSENNQAYNRSSEDKQLPNVGTTVYTNRTRAEEPQSTIVYNSAQVSNHESAGNNDELNLFFQFLKAKMQKLPPAAIGEVQAKFFNILLEKEAVYNAKV